MNPKYLQLAFRALDEIHAQLTDADGDPSTFNFRSQGGWFYPADGGDEMRRDTIDVEQAKKYFLKLINL